MKHYVLGDVIIEISERENNPSNSGHERFVGLGHYVSGEVEIENYGSTANLNSAMKVFNSGDILVARRNVYLKRASVVYFDGLTSGDSIVLRPKNETIGRILPFILNTDDFWDYADKYSDGTMSKRLSPKVLKQYEFDLPDDNLEQLADILWAMVDVKKSYQRLLKQTDELVKSQFIEMFGTESKQKEYCDYVALKEICEKDSSNITMRSVENVDGEYPLYGAAGFIKNINGYKKDKPYVAIIKDGAGVGRVQSLPAYSSIINTMQYIIPNQDITLEYLAQLIISMDLGKDFTGSTIPHIYFKDYGKRIVPKPPIELQKQFSTFVEQSDKSKFELKQAIEGVDILIKSMIQQELN